MKKKLIAGMTSTALIASIGAPAFAANFSDVNGHWAAATINKLADAGIINGMDASHFSPEGTLTRAQFAKLVSVALKLDTTSTTSSFADVSGWAVGFVEAAKKAGIINGTDATHFDPEGVLTREQAAAIMVRALRTVGELQPGTSLNFPDAAQVSSWFKSDIEVAVTNGLLNGKDGKLAPQGSATRAEAAVLTDRFVTKSDELKAAVKDLKVASVSAINAKQLQINFNQAVDKSTVVNGSNLPLNVTFSRVTNDTTITDKNVLVADVTNATLSDDGKSLTLTLNPAGTKLFDGTYSVTVSANVATKSGKSLTAYASTFTSADKTNPFAKGVTYNTITGDVEVALSEPVAAVPTTVRLNGAPVTTAGFKTGSNQTVVRFAKPAGVAAGSTATLYVAGAQDVAGNVLDGYTGSVNLTNDTTPLQVSSITQIASNKAQIVFNKSIGNDAAVAGAITVLIDGSALTPGEIVVAKDTNDTSNKTYTVTINRTNTAAPTYFYGTDSSKTVTVAIAANTIADVFGNKLAATTQNVSMTKDVAGPAIASAALNTTSDKINVTFDKAISATVDATKITLRKDGVALGTVAAAQMGTTNGDEKVLVISPASTDLVSGKLPSGNYTVRLDAGAVTDVNTNQNAAVNTSVAFTATSADLTAAITTAAAVNRFEVAFSEAVTSTSALNPANYTLDGAALPSGTDLYIKGSSTADSKTVVIQLPSKSVNIGVVGAGTSANLAVKNVQTAAGKTVVATSGTVTVEDNTPATLQSATLIGGNILKLTFDENMGSNYNLADLVISSDAGTFAVADTTTASPAVPATTTESTSAKDMIITVTPGNSNWATVTAGNNLKVKTAGSTQTATIKDADGVLANAGVQVSVSK